MTMTTPSASRLAELLGQVDSVQSMSDANLAALSDELVEHARLVRDGSIPVTDGDMVGMLSEIADACEGAWGVINDRAERRTAVEKRLGIAPAADPEPAPEPEPQPAAVPALGTVTTPMAHRPVVTGGTSRLERLADRTDVDFDEFVRDVTGAIEQLQSEEGSVNAGPRRVPLAKIAIPFPEERQLHNAGASRGRAPITPGQSGR
jgi:hypothetical protein